MAPSVSTKLSKKAKLHHDGTEEADPLEEDDSDDSDDTAELMAAAPAAVAEGDVAEVAAAAAARGADDSEYLRRWVNEDRPTMLKLLKRGVAMYEWDRPAMESQQITSASDLVGDYDILFVHGVGEGTDQGWGDTGKPLSRTVVPGANLSFVAKTLAPGDDYYNAYEVEWNDVVLGRLQGVEKSSDDSFDYNWEYVIQMDDVRLRLHVMDSDYSFVDASDGCDRGQDEECRIKVLTNSGSLKWIPRESHPLDDEQEYLDFMHEYGLNRLHHHDQDGYWWKGENSWLCNHKGLPVEAARSIHLFNLHPMPPKEFEWKEGDILVEMEDLCDYATSWSTIYLARPRTNALKCRLIEEATRAPARNSNS